MVTILRRCPKCGDKLSRADHLVEGQIVLWCRACKMKAGFVEGVSPEWIPDSEGQTAWLEASIRRALQWKAAVEAEEDDRRWEAFGG